MGVVEVKTCSTCYKDKPVSEFAVDNGKKDKLKVYCRSCDAERNKKNQRTPRGQYNLFVRTAKVRKKEVSLTFEEYLPLKLQPCYYCGGSLPETSGGLDRIDSRLGYTAANVVPCCWRCNTMKSALSLEDFYAHIKRILTYRNLI